jgi:hypothetical protein
LRLGNASIRRGKRDLGNPAGKMILLLGNEFGEAVIDDAAILVDLCGQFDRRLGVTKDLLIVLVAVNDLLAHVEVVERRQRAHALTDVLVASGDVIEFVEELFWKKCVYASIRIGCFLHLVTRLSSMTFVASFY